MMTRMLLSAICASGVTAIALPLEAAPAGLPVDAWSVVDEDQVKGTIQSVNLEEKKFVLKAEDGDITIYFTSKTEYFIDGKKSTREEALRVGAKASVTHESMVAAKVNVTTK